MYCEHKFIKLADGTELHAELREAGKPIWIIATHGICEHLGRHSYLNDLFGHDFNICQYDLRGHGRSMGDKCHINDFYQYMRDLHEIILFLKKTFRMERFALFGHSMGGLITSGYLKTFAKDDFYPELVFVNAPALGFPGVLGEIIKNTPSTAWKFIAKCPLSIPLGGLVDLDSLSHDPMVKEDYIKDDLNCLKPHTKLLFEMVAASKEIASSPINPKCEMHVTIGSEDQVVNVSSVNDYFTTIEKSVHFKFFENAFHEIHNEIEKYRKPYLDHLSSVFMELRYKEDH
jgi:acylglycerol lipase